MMTWDDDDLAVPVTCVRCGQPQFTQAWGYQQDGWVCVPCIRAEQTARIAALAAANCARPRDLPRQRTSAGLCWDDAA